MNYSAETIASHLKWYEVISDFTKWEKLVKSDYFKNNNERIVLNLGKINDIFKTLQFERPYKGKWSFVKETLFEEQELVEFKNAGFINFDIDKEKDYVIIYPAFVEIKKNVKVSKKIMTITISDDAKKLYDLFCEVQKKYFIIKPRPYNWQKDFQMLLDKVPYADIEKIILSLPKLEFWKDKILSPKSFAKHYNKLCIEAKKIQGEAKPKKEIKLNII